MASVTVTGSGTAGVASTLTLQISGIAASQSINTVNASVALVYPQLGIAHILYGTIYNVSTTTSSSGTVTLYMGFVPQIAGTPYIYVGSGFITAGGYTYYFGPGYQTSPATITISNQGSMYPSATGSGCVLGAPATDGPLAQFYGNFLSTSAGFLSSTQWTAYSLGCAVILLQYSLPSTYSAYMNYGLLLRTVGTPSPSRNAAVLVSWGGQAPTSASLYRCGYVSQSQPTGFENPTGASAFVPTGITFGKPQTITGTWTTSPFAPPFSQTTYTITVQPIAWADYWPTAGYPILGYTAGGITKLPVAGNPALLPNSTYYMEVLGAQSQALPAPSATQPTASGALALQAALQTPASPLARVDQGYGADAAFLQTRVPRPDSAQALDTVLVQQRPLTTPPLRAGQVPLVDAPPPRYLHP